MHEETVQSWPNVPTFDKVLEVGRKHRLYMLWRCGENQIRPEEPQIEDWTIMVEQFRQPFT